YIDKYEVTNAQYGAFLRETGRAEPSFWHSKVYSDPKQPVVGVSWDDAVAYAEWTGKRLPTEEEWEKAARGTDGFFWPWGNEPSAGKYNGAAQRNYKPMDVGSFKAGASPYGVMDMAGNVYELTTGKWVNGRLAMRGGSYLNGGAHTRTMFRWALKGERGVEFLGFRCVLDVERVSPPTTLEYKHVDAAPAELWGVVYGADKEIDKARYEVETIANKLGLSDANIYYRNGWYRSVATTTDRSHAGDLLVKARSRRDGAYIVRMSAWCPSPFEEDGYFACPSR
ncbi:MAG: formylglycine-generating enzyme family protein, partial [Gammaproteobacteria bacterium]|nr:formylglycine-generating enzyme family protein [Gammaproteobacteria bacterium]